MRPPFHTRVVTAIGSVFKRSRRGRADDVNYSEPNPIYNHQGPGTQPPGQHSSMSYMAELEGRASSRIFEADSGTPRNQPPIRKGPVILIG